MELSEPMIVHLYAIKLIYVCKQITPFAIRLFGSKYSERWLTTRFSLAYPDVANRPTVKQVKWQHGQIGQIGLLASAISEPFS